jgi:hypothetical protein
MNVHISQQVLQTIAKEVNEEAFTAQTKELGRYASAKDNVKVDLASLSERQMEVFKKCVEALPDAEKSKENALRTLRSWEAVSKDPKGAKCGSLQHLTTFLRKRLEQCPNHWLFHETQDGFMTPYFVLEIAYEPPDARYRQEAQVRVSLKAFNKFIPCQANLFFRQRDLSGRKTADELFASKGYFCETEKLAAAYDKQVAAYKSIKDKTGEQHLGRGKAISLGDHYREEIVPLEHEGEPARCVIDDIEIEDNQLRNKDLEATVSSSYWTGKEEESEVLLPVLPYVKVFGLIQHSHAMVHVDNLTPYPYNPDLDQKLVLPEENKDIISTLVHDAGSNYEDIIAGKAGGIIVLSTGEPGVGKTLTAEVYSEVIGRALYVIQCSQLGTDEEKLEKNLRLVLKRATRWKAVLLIDECDVYVRARGEDLQQNAIVGIFLRVLEYYKGVLFLTSNRGMIVDDAILSRVTAHVKYEYPTQDELLQIWNILCDINKIQLSQGEKKQLVQTFPNATGRNVKMLLKLFQRMKHRRPQEDNLKLFQRAAKFVDMPERNPMAAAA